MEGKLNANEQEGNVFMKLIRRSCMPVLAVLIGLLPVSCSTPAGPSEAPTPDGAVIAWFNGLGNTVDLYFPGCDSLLSDSYITGSAPNFMLYTGSDRLAVLSSLSSLLQVLDVSTSGSVLHEISLPAGSNPWAMASGYDNLWITLLLTGQIVTVSTDTWTVGGAVEVPDYPYGIALAAGRIFVSHGDFFPDTTAGGVTVINAVTLDEEGWLDTGRNTTELWYSGETGMVHAFSSTFTGDGGISIIDPVSLEIAARINTGGNPLSPVVTGDHFACADAWGSSVFFYDESGALLSTWTPEQSMTIGGIAVSGDTLYMTDFTGDQVHRALWQSGTMLPPLAAGDGPQGIVSIDR